MWTVHRSHDVTVSKSESMLPSNHSVMALLSTQNTGHQQRPLHSITAPQSSLQHLLAPSTLPHVQVLPLWSKPPGYYPAGTCHVAFLFRVLCPSNPLCTQLPERVFQSTNVITSHPCLKDSDDSPSFQNRAPTPQLKPQGPAQGPGPTSQHTCCDVQSAGHVLVASSRPLHTLTLGPGGLTPALPPG